MLCTIEMSLHNFAPHYCPRNHLVPVSDLVNRSASSSFVCRYLISISPFSMYSLNWANSLPKYLDFVCRRDVPFVESVIALLLSCVMTVGGIFSKTANPSKNSL